MAGRALDGRLHGYCRQGSPGPSLLHLLLASPLSATLQMQPAGDGFTAAVSYRDASGSLQTLHVRADSRLWAE